MSQRDGPPSTTALRWLLAAGVSVVPGMVPGATKRNVLLVIAYLLVGLLVVGMASDPATAQLKLPRLEAKV